MKLVSMTCTQCGARLPDQPESGHYKCSYCGSRFAAPKPKAPKTPKPSIPTGPRLAEVAQQAVRRSLWGLLGSMVGGIVALGGAGLLIYQLVGQSARQSIVPMLQGTASGIRLGSPTRALWDRVGGPPVAAQVGGHEAVLGRMRLDGDQLFIVASDAETAKPLWKIGPLGTYGEGYQATHFLVADKRVVVTDARGTLHIHDLASGKEQKSVPLSDRATHLCPGPDGTVALAVADRHHLSLDISTLALRESALPPGCTEHRRPFRMRIGHDTSHLPKPALRGFEVQRVYAEADLGVAAVVKAPGTPIPHVVGYTPQSREVRWQELLPTVEPLSVRASEHDGLSAGRYVAIYGVGSSSHWRMTALAARDGARLWDVELRPLFAVDDISALLLTPRFAYVNRTSSLEIFDAATGKLIGTIGNETYR